jgi:hypothetical protein
MEKDSSLYEKVTNQSGKLSITGVEGPLANGNALGASGQIIMHEWLLKTYADGWDADKVGKLREVWEDWHLNDMRAGTPAQMAFLKQARTEADYPYPSFQSTYDWNCSKLKEAGLYEDNGYRFGHSWLREEVPADVIGWLRALPDADKKPAWC